MCRWPFRKLPGFFVKALIHIVGWNINWHFFSYSAFSKLHHYIFCTSYCFYIFGLPLWSFESGLPTSEMIKSCLCLVDSECNRSRIIWRQKIYGQFSKEFQCGNKKGNCHIKQVLILDFFILGGYLVRKGIWIRRHAQRHIFPPRGGNYVLIKQC